MVNAKYPELTRLARNLLDENKADTYSNNKT